MRTFFVVLVLAAGCTDSMLPADQQAQFQTEYDFTVRADRERFHPQDLLFQGSVGPYAIYQVTGAHPTLVGPYVRATRNYSMLCGGTRYFTDAREAPRAMITLSGGRHGDVPFCHAQQEPTPPGSCSPPQDTFGNPIPDMGGGGGSSDDMGPTQPPVFDPPGSEDMAGANPPIDQTGGGDVNQIVVKLTEVPPMGSLVLVRRVALTDQRQHNGSHVIPDICCANGQCALRQ